jgi:co-chaperonin GroES (HSP10)
MHDDHHHNGAGPRSIRCRNDYSKHLLMAAATNSNQHPEPIITSKNDTKKRKKKKKAVKWIACSTTKMVASAIQMYIKEGDTVAELGSQLRESSTALCDAIGPEGRAVLVDIQRKFPNEKKDQARTTAMRRRGEEETFYPDRATFAETKSFESWRQALFFSDKGKSKYHGLVVDVGAVAGNDLDLTCLSLVKEFLALNTAADGDDEDDICRVVIIKSGSLYELAKRLFHAEKIFTGVQSLDSGFDKGVTSIIGTVGVDEYRKTIPYVVKEGDAVIEVGSHFGTSTTLLHNAARGQQDCDSSIGGCIGVDVGAHIIKSAKKKFPNVPFEVGDAWKMAELARMKSKYFSDHPSHRVYDAVYVDVGGLSGSEGLLEAISLLSSITNSLEPRCIVIKSLCMRRLASSLVPFSEVRKMERERQTQTTE